MNTLKLNSAGLNRVTLNTIGEVRFKSRGGEPKPPSYENGVYIQHIDGKLYTTEEWTAAGYASDTANGVAVVADECSFVISKDYPSPAFYKWGGYGVLVEGITTTTTLQEAVLDFDGLNNTSKITSQLKDYTDTYGNVGAPCADVCSAYTFPNGKKGYLPALGELVTLDNNKSKIDSIMSLIEGTAIKINPHASSTQYDSGKYWSISQRDNSALNGRSKSSADAYYGPYVRPFTTL